MTAPRTVVLAGVLRRAGAAQRRMAWRWPPYFLLVLLFSFWEMHLVACRFSNPNGLDRKTHQITEVNCFQYFPRKKKRISEVLVTIVYTQKVLKSSTIDVQGKKSKKPLVHFISGFFSVVENITVAVRIVLARCRYVFCFISQ